jgi:hypothetical protein
VTSTFDDHPQPATIRIATGAANGANLEVLATCIGMQERRLMLNSTERISLSTPVSIEYNDALFLGEIMLCKPDSTGSFTVEVKVEQVLTGLESLMALRAGLMGDAAAAQQRAFAPIALRSRPSAN